MDTDKLRILFAKLPLSNPNFIFFLSLAVFVVDSAVNVYFDIPVFVPFMLLLLPILYADLLMSGRLNRFLVVFSILFIASFLVSGFIYGFERRSLSDLTFILFFACSFYYYQSHAKAVSMRGVHIFAITMVLMFSFTFFGINSNSYTDDGASKQQQPSTNVAPRNITHNNEPLDILEYQRDYNYGIFRIPHVATYLLGFTALLYGFLFLKKRKWFFLIASVLLFIFMFHTGVRTFAVAMILALVTYYIRRRTMWVIAAFSIIGVLMLIFRYWFYHITHQTPLEPFSSLLITLVDNSDRLSRVLIWKSWLLEMQELNWYNLLFGKSFYQSILANQENLHKDIWFHNDFFSIVFSYGILALGAYIVFFVKMYRAYAFQIRSNVFVFIFFVTLPAAAFINGMYYYFPIFVLYMFFVMVELSNKKNYS